MPAPYDSRRFRTTVPITLPIGTLMLPTPEGRLVATSPDADAPLSVSVDLAAAERLGLVRQLADGQA